MTSTTSASGWRALVRHANTIVALLIVLAAVMVAVGIAIEVGSRNAETGIESTHNEGTESAEGTEGTAVEGGVEGGVEGATLAGVSLESPLVIGGLLVASVALAFVVWRSPSVGTAVAALAFTLAAAAFDIAEFSHQAAEGALGLFALVGVILTLRLLTVVGAIVMIRMSRGRLGWAAV